LSKSLKILILLLVVLIIGGIGYVLLSRNGGDTVAMSGATAVGVPKGPATTKSIGPAGGSLASSDGRITIDVPPNAVTGIELTGMSMGTLKSISKSGGGSMHIDLVPLDTECKP
jgi:hypothetical protein